MRFSEIVQNKKSEVYLDMDGVLDYKADKKQYLENIWKIMNWTVINVRWGKSL